MIKKITERDVVEASKWTYGNLVKAAIQAGDKLAEANFCKHTFGNGRRNRGMESKCGALLSEINKINKYITVKKMQERGLL